MPGAAVASTHLTVTRLAALISSGACAFTNNCPHARPPPFKPLAHTPSAIACPHHTTAPRLPALTTQHELASLPLCRPRRAHHAAARPGLCAPCAACSTCLLHRLQHHRVPDADGERKLRRRRERCATRSWIWRHESVGDR